jgi:hypothetical protein
VAIKKASCPNCQRTLFQAAPSGQVVGQIRCKSCKLMVLTIADDTIYQVFVDAVGAELLLRSKGRIDYLEAKSYIEGLDHVVTEAQEKMVPWSAIYDRLTRRVNPTTLGS